MIRMVDKTRIEKFRASFERRAERCLYAYQETGVSRYNTERYRLEDLAEICALALDNYDSYMKMLRLKAEIGDLARTAAAGDPEELKKMALKYGRLEGFGVFDEEAAR